MTAAHGQPEPKISMLSRVGAADNRTDLLESRGVHEP